jgi:diguanylate cyclase (GGDEF)-like protein
MRILLVEDDELIAESLTKALGEQRYMVDAVADGQAAWELVESFTYDLILLDVVLPGIDGLSLCRQLRSQGNQIPILLLTAQDASTSKVVGLDAGADDYLAKPFDLPELLARIRALLRRGGVALPPLLEWRNLQLDPSVCQVRCNDQPLHLTPKEYGLLELFLRNHHRIFSCSALIDQLWSLEEPPTEETVRSHVKGLRQKLKAAGVVDDPIETVYGIGYRLKPAEPEVQKRKQPEPKRNAVPQSNQDEPNTLPTQDNATQDNATDNAELHSANSAHASGAVSTANSQVATIWERAKASLDQRVSVIEQATTLLQQGKLSQVLRSEAEREAHRLIGSLGMFGSDEGSQIAQAIESLLTDGQPLNQPQIQQLAQMVMALRQQVQHLETGAAPELLAEPEPEGSHPWLLIAEPDRSLTEALTKEAARWGMSTRIAPDAAQARRQLSNRHPDAVLLDLSRSADVDDGLALLTELSGYTPPVPVLVLTGKDSLIDRVKIARLGGRRVLQKPLSPAQILESVNQVLHHAHTATARVLVVDDDPQILMSLQTLLSPWGIKVTTLSDPLRFLDTLAIASPDLLILDVDMPHVSGIELCQVIRNDPRWSGLPVLFLTAYTDVTTRCQVFAAGADDYVSKPIVDAELITRILNRLERSRLLRNLAETDALTGAANRYKSTQELTQFLQWSEHQHQPFCFAVLDLDNLKSINHQYGHISGDQVLFRLGELLRQTFHSEDVVGRWGGSEFVIGMAAMTRQDGIQRLTELLKKLRQTKFMVSEGQPFQASFSAAVVQFPQDGPDLHALYQTADMILERAKAAGGDRILSS